MKSFLVIMTLVINFVSLTFAQAPDTAWTKTYHRGNYDDCKWIEETSDSGFALVGVSGMAGNNWLDIFLVRTDANGNTLWTHTYGDTIIGQEAFCVREDIDGCFVIAGIKHLTMTLRNAWIIKTDSNGDTLWTMKYGGERNAEAHNICCTSDGGYIVTGWKYDPGEFANVFLLKLDNSGDYEWARTFGGGGYEEGFCVQQTTDGGYMIAGSKDITGRILDFYLIKTDSNGIYEWSETYGGENNDHCTSAQQTSDGGYIMYGESDSFIPNSGLAVKTDSLGNTLWVRSYSRSICDYGWSVNLTSDGGFIFGGYTNNYGYRDDYWFIRTDDYGDTLWMQSVGHGDDQRGYCILQTSDGGYVMAGYSAESSPTLGDFYVVKLNAFNTDIKVNRNMPYTFELSQNYPNPFNPTTTISFAIEHPQLITLKVYDLLGRKVCTLIDEDRQAGLHNVVFDASELSSGIYFYRLQAGDMAESKRMVLLK